MHDMFGMLYSSAPVRCADGQMGDSVSGYIPGIRTFDPFGNIGFPGRPRKGESVREFIRRNVARILDEHETVHRAAVVDGQGFILAHGQYVRPWWQRTGYTITVDAEPGYPGSYRVGVHRYVVSLRKGEA